MNILTTQFSLDTSSLDIYVSGCNAHPKCAGCHNPESWDFNKGELYTDHYFQKLKKKVETFDILIKNIFVLGGEPLDQDLFELGNLLYDLSLLKKDIWLFTRYSLDHVPLEIIRPVRYLKTGEYKKSLEPCYIENYGISLASNNQSIHKLF